MLYYRCYFLYHLYSTFVHNIRNIKLVKFCSKTQLGYYVLFYFFVVNYDCVPPALDDVTLGLFLPFRIGEKITAHYLLYTSSFTVQSVRIILSLYYNGIILFCVQFQQRWRRRITFTHIISLLLLLLYTMTTTNKLSILGNAIRYNIVVLYRNMA